MPKRTFSFAASALATLAALSLAGTAVRADTTPFNLTASNFFQDWSNINLITTDNDWSGVPSITGYLGEYSAANPTDVDPRTLTGTMTDLSLATVSGIANQTSPNSLTVGGVAEFESMDPTTPANMNPTVALQATDLADAPFLMLFLDTTGRQNVFLQYNLRDIDSSSDNGDQPIDLQYRVGNTGDFTSLPFFISDVTLGPNLGSAGTGPIQVVLPDAVNDHLEVQIRWMTTNSADGDEWVGVDDIVVTSQEGPRRDIPEPATALLLVPLLAGGIAARHRRR
jgi:hypothetical protein